MFVGNHMTPDPVTVGPNTPIVRVAEVARHKSIRHLPVVDDAGRLVGIVTDRDIRSATGYDPTQHLDLHVEEIMSPDPTTISADAPLEEAVIQLFRKRFGALPVMDQGRLVGIITRHDIVRAMYNLLGLDREGMRIEVALPDRKPDLAAALDVIRRCDGELISVIAARVRDDGSEPALYLRIAGTDKHTVEDELRKAGLILLGPEKRR